MLRLSAALDSPKLGLHRVDDGGGDPEIAWAHVSELADPTQWLAGRELLLTTGLELFHRPDDSREFLRRIADRDVSALGLSTGASLPHQRIPDGLVAAGAEFGVPIVHVPERTPLQSVVRFVSDALNLAETEPLRRALIAQRKLGEAATREDGVVAVLESLADSSSISASVRDLSLTPIAEVGEGAAEAFAGAEAGIRRRLLRGGQWTMADETADRTTLISPIRTLGRTRGVLLATKRLPMTFFDRTLVSMVSSLLSMLLELRHAGEAARRTARAGAVESLVSGELSEIDATLALAAVGVQCERIQALVLPADADPEAVLALASQWEPHSAGVLAATRDDHHAVLVCDPDETFESVAAESVELAGLGPAGLGMPAALVNASLSLGQALRARSLARSKGVQLSILSASEGYRTLLALGGAEERAAFSDAVLGPLDDHDARYRTGLVHSLSVYFASTLNLEASARSLGIHRHTMRARLERIGELTGKDLTESSELLEFWIACESRALATAP